ncbi:lactonase family protein [Sporolactobacillus sp. STCC-11]|uniref:lactonase family protein n=1 Tax=Sporolactobacillus caesalpiniae TaxID=3230362 RepID=UPI003390A43D
MGLGYIGTYTNGESIGIYSFSLDENKEQLSSLEVAAHLDNPTYLAINKDQTRLYSVVKEGNKGGVCSFALSQDGTLKKITQDLTEGAPPCYLNTNNDDTILVAANYHKGAAAAYRWNTEKDNELTEITTVHHEGHGANPERQEHAHVHFADFTPDQRSVVTVDLGTDQLITYDLQNEQFQQRSICIFAPGTGPRHLVFHPNARFAYVLSELSSEIIVLQFDPERGSFTRVQTVSSLPDNNQDHNQGGAIKISADGRFIYVSNRGHDSIGSYQVREEGGTLKPVGFCPSGGEWPRDFELDPSGNFVIVANQNSNNLVLFKRNKETGLLTNLRSSLSVPNPVCVKFLK